MQAALRRHFGRNISFDEALDLARVHTISSLLSDIQETLDVQMQKIDAVRRFDHAVHEAKLGPQSVEERIESRRNMILANDGSTAAHVDSEKLRRSLLELTERVVTWRHEYAAFLRAFESLYHTRVNQLHSLRLLAGEFEEARAQIDRLFEEALDKSVEAIPS